jgi:hypothetical protein
MGIDDLGGGLEAFIGAGVPQDTAEPLQGRDDLLAAPGGDAAHDMARAARQELGAKRA